jgi:Carboxylesterase family
MKTRVLPRQELMFGHVFQVLRGGQNFLSHVCLLSLELAARLLTFLCCVPALVVAQSHPVRTVSGFVSGVALSHGLEVYEGIPFAAPPVGNLRWRPPQAPAPWQGCAKQMTSALPACSQDHHSGLDLGRGYSRFNYHRAKTAWT